MTENRDIEQFDNLDLLKQQWKQLAARTDKLEDANRRLSERLAKSKVTSLQEMLATRIDQWGRVGYVLPLLAPALYYIIHIPWWYCLLYALFGIAMALTSVWFAGYVREKRLTILPVAEAVERAVSIKLIQTRMRMCSFVAGMALLVLGGFLLPEVEERESVVLGGITGLIVGLAISIPRCIANARMARRMVEELQQIK